MFLGVRFDVGGMEDNNVAQFVVGGSYSCTSACDSGCRWSFRVTRRTASSIWIADDDGKITRRKVEVYRGAEMVFPLGKYSMAPIIRADERK